MTKDYRSSESGKYVKKAFADENTSTTVKESRSIRKKKIKTAPDFSLSLEAAVIGLTLQSETDAPLELRPPGWFRAVPFEQFCRNLSGTGAAKFRALVEKNLTDVSVIYFGGVRKQVVLFGRDSKGKWYAAVSIAVET